MLFVRENTEGEYAGVGGVAHRGLPLEVGIETSVFTRGGFERVLRHAFELARRAPRRGHERDEVECLPLRLRALGRGRGGGGGRASGRAVRARARGRARRPHRARPRQLSTSSSRRTCSRTSSPTSPPRSRAGWAWRRQRERRAGVGRAGRVRAGARLGAGHRRTGDRESLRSDLERLAAARASRRDGGGASVMAALEAICRDGPRTPDVGGSADHARGGRRRRCARLQRRAQRKIPIRAPPATTRAAASDDPPADRLALAA